MNIFITSFYINSPVVVQHCMVTARGLAFRLLRQDNLFKKILSDLEKSQYYSKEELRQLQNEKLGLIVRHSYENVPYYKKLFRELRLTPEDFKDAGDLEKLPFITKNDVRKNPEDFLAVNINRRFIRKIFTSGTTGSPLKVYRDLYSINFENAILARQYRWAGFGEGDKRVILRSSPIVNSSVRKAPFWRYDFFQKAMMASSYHLSRQNIEYYVKEILKYGPIALETVPSSGYLMAKLLKLNGSDIQFKYMFTSSEVLMPHQKRFMEDQFRSRIYDHYGVAERVCAIGMCEKGNYHIYPEYGITELLPLSYKKDCFEIAGTTLNNFAMPLLRYKTGDIVTPSYSRCTCGRNFERVERIEGRKTDNYFVTKDGRMVSLLSGILSIDLKDVIETQFIQEDLDRIRVRLVAGDGYSASDESLLRKNIKNYLGNDIEIYIERVSSIPRTQTGKFKQFISKEGIYDKIKFQS